MKTFKRIIALLCVLLISAAFPVSGSAAGTPAVKANSVSVYKGSSVNVTVSAADFASVACFDLEIHYDSAAFTLNSTSKGSFMSGCSASVNSNTAGVVVVSAAKPDGISGSGTLLTLSFTAKSESNLQTYPITVAVGEAYDVSLSPVSIASSSGSITVTERPVSVVNYYLGITPSVSSLQCGEITTLTVKNTYNRSFVSADFTVEYDSSMFEVDQVVLNNSLKTASAVYSVNTAIKGVVRISYATTTAVSAYNLFTVSLKAISDINASSKITAAVSNAYSDSETAYNGSTVSCTLNLSKIPEQVVLPKLYFTAQRADYSQSFTASLYVEENSEVAAGDFVLTYDKTVLECQSVRASQDTDGMIVINPNHSVGQIRFSYVNEAECTGNEKWLEITFRPLVNDAHYTLGAGGYGVVDAEMNSISLEYESFTDCIYTVTTVLPDCVNQGYDTYICNECEKSFTDNSVAPLGHDMGAWYTVTAPTCTGKGQEKRDCSRCDYSEVRDIAPTNHAGKYTVERTEPTCTEDGFEEGVYCPDCNTWLSVHGVIAKFGHKIVTDKAVAPTCTRSGKTEGKHCSVCGTIITEQKTVSATGHTYKTTKTLATTSKDGKTVTACTVCGYVSKTITYYKASSIKLSATAYTYNGKAQKPTVTVKNSKGTTLKNGTDYTVAYSSGCKNTGKYTVTVKFKGNYTGSKSLSFNILPGKTSSLTASQSTTSIKATWKAVTGASGYKVTLYSAKNKAIKTVYTTKTAASFTKLSQGTTYKIRLTAYKTIDGKKVYSSVYTQLTTATKPGTPTLKVTAGSKKAMLSWNKQTGATGYVVYMATSKNGKYTKITTLKGNTKVSYTKTGLTKGKTYYFKVAAYETVGGKNIYGSFSSVKYAKIK